MISRSWEVFLFLNEGQDPGGLVDTVSVKRVDAGTFADVVGAAIGALDGEEERSIGRTLTIDRFLLLGARIGGLISRSAASS